jgi:hypothetical protein
MIDFFALQSALYQQLKSNLELNSLVGGVYDYVPDATPYPYVLFGGLTARRDSAVDLSRRLLVEQTIRGYSNDADSAKGWQQVRDIATLVFALFDYWVFVVNGQRLQALVSSVNILPDAGTVRACSVVVQIYFT